MSIKEQFELEFKEELKNVTDIEKDYLFNISSLFDMYSCYLDDGEFYNRESFVKEFFAFVKETKTAGSCDCGIPKDIYSDFDDGLKLKCGKCHSKIKNGKLSIEEKLHSKVIYLGDILGEKIDTIQEELKDIKKVKKYLYDIEQEIHTVMIKNGNRIIHTDRKF